MKELLQLGLFVLALVLVGSVAYIAQITQERAFRAMSPTEHLEAARLALKEGHFDDGARHVAAIADTDPKVLEARQLAQEIGAAREAAEARQIQEQRKKQLAAQTRELAVRDLQDVLKNLGYDLTVGQSDKSGKVSITSKDFDDTERRVRFLSFLRSRSSPLSGVCSAGFEKVELKSSALPFVGFSDTYSLDCFNRN
jgi:hypothetical protein